MIVVAIYWLSSPPFNIINYITKKCKTWDNFEVHVLTEQVLQTALMPESWSKTSMPKFYASLLHASRFKQDSNIIIKVKFCSFNTLVTVPSECYKPSLSGGIYNSKCPLPGTPTGATHHRWPHQNVITNFRPHFIALGAYLRSCFWETNTKFCMLVKLKCNVNTYCNGVSFSIVQTL